MGYSDQGSGILAESAHARVDQWQIGPRGKETLGDPEQRQIIRAQGRPLGWATWCGEGEKCCTRQFWRNVMNTHSWRAARFRLMRRLAPVAKNLTPFWPDSARKLVHKEIEGGFTRPIAAMELDLCVLFLSRARRAD